MYLKRVGYIFTLVAISLLASGATIKSVRALMLQPTPNIVEDAATISLENLLVNQTSTDQTTPLQLENQALLVTPAWQQLSPNPDPTNGSPAARFNHAMAYHQGSNTVFIFGGQASSSTFFNDVWALDFETLTWERLYANNGSCNNTTCPIQRRTAIMTVDDAGQNLYVATGEDSGKTRYNDIWRFNLSNNTWQKLSSTNNPGVRYGAAGGNLGGNLLISHGFGASNPPRYDDTWLFNVGTGQWTDISPSGTPPVGRCLLDGVAAGDKFVIHGGQSGPTDADPYRADTWILDTTAETWTQVTTNIESPDKPDGRRFQSLAYAESENGVLLFGGLGDSSVRFNDVWLLNLNTNTWEEVSPTGTPPSARRSHAAEWIEATTDLGGGMLIFGGTTASGDSNALNQLWLLTYSLPISANPGVLQFDSAAYEVVEADTTATITVSRTSGVSGTVTVDYATSNGTATAGSDYTSVAETLVFNEGETEMTFTVPISADGNPEGDETVNLILKDPSGASLGSQDTATLTILDSDTAGTLQFSQSNYSAPETAGNITITVSRTGGVSGTVTVDYATSGDDATAGTDYTEVNGTLTFNNGQATAQTFTIPITDDNEAEGPEMVNLSLTGPTGGAVLGSPNKAVFTIEDDEMTGTFIYLPVVLKDFTDLVDEHGADLIDLLFE